MALKQFLTALQVARGVLFGRINEPANGQPTGPAHLPESAKRAADVWFTSDLVKDFNEADFRFLPAAEHKQLKQAIEDFRQLTAGSQGSLPSDAQLQQGCDLFTKIHGILAPHFGEEPDTHRILEAIRSVHAPDYVLWVEYELFTDSTNDPAVWIWLVLEDDVEIESLAIHDELALVRRAIREALQRAGINRWPYVRVRTRTETKSHLVGAA
jgi:hypothetical protein